MSERREKAMRELTEQRDAHQKREDVSKGRRGLVIVNTGNGKGKSTAALGLMMRANGRGLKTKLFQFLKHENAKFGEHRSLDALEIEYQGLGDGFTWRSKDLDNTAALAAEGWETAKAAILGGEYDLIVLDEFTYPLTYGWVEWADVQATLDARHPDMHVVITGRSALPELIAYAQTVTEMQPVKHAFDTGIGAQAGIEH
ncbi:cob(I)yrinic acid a,c-diamide adenosyltransferase [Deinococcus sp.]|uniref:cob(I)yrinic acid a,c-diamide adenosyltransferase n=1 Tax=Deinococcus sp. TaxID=47478 RepID=UPI003B58CC3F